MNIRKTSVDYFSEELLRKDLKKKAVRSGAITVVAQLAAVWISLAAIPTLARLLDKEDFGLVAMVAVVTNFAIMFVDAGLSMATVQREKITRQQVTNLFWIASLFGTIVAISVACLSPAIAWFYDEPRLVLITIALAISFLFSGFTVQHQALMQRGMQFGALSVVRIVAALLGQTAGIVWAWIHFGKENDYWALVLIPIVIAGVRMMGIWICCRWRPGRPKRGSGTRSMVEFGANLTGFNFVNFFSRNADNLLIGWWWGAASLGLYDQAYKIFLMPLRLVNAPLSGVMIPALSRLSSDKPRLIAAYLQALKLQLLILVPVVGMIAVHAESVVVVVLSSKWIEAAPILQYLALVGLVQPLTSSTGWLFISQGKTREILYATMVNGASTILAFAIAIPYGPVGMAAAYAIGGIGFRLPFLLFYMHRHKIIRVQEVLRTVAHTLPPCIGVIVANLLLVATTDFQSAFVAVGASVAVSAIAWCVGLAATHHGREFFKQIKSMAKMLAP